MKDSADSAWVLPNGDSVVWNEMNASTGQSGKTVKASLSRFALWGSTWAIHLSGRLVNHALPMKYMPDKRPQAGSKADGQDKGN